MKRMSVALLVALVALIALWNSASARSRMDLSVQPGEVVLGDKWMAGQIVKNDGTIKGDMVCWGQTISSTGPVEGDIIGAGQNISVTGKVTGNVRAAGATIDLRGEVGKNATLFGNNIDTARGSTINGTLLAVGNRVDVEGKVRGRTTIGARTAILGGEFFGDVEINNFTRREPRRHGGGVAATVTVLPGTVIHGTLRFRGSQADIQPGAQVEHFEWKKAGIVPPSTLKADIYRSAWRFVRFLFTTAAWFCVGLLFLKLFPSFFNRMVETVSKRPWNSVGYGAVAVFSAIVVLIACIVLLVLSLIMSPGFGLVSAAVAVSFYLTLFFVATIPAALWIGGMLLKERSIAYRLAAGLIVLNFSLFLCALLSKVAVAGVLFSIIQFLARVGVVLLGGGALLYTLKESLAKARTLPPQNQE
jgi:hypothetical protein